jgi:hypothetical protein
MQASILQKTLNALAFFCACLIVLIVLLARVSAIVSVRLDYSTYLLLKNKKALVTGGAGFIGPHMVDEPRALRGF